MGLQVAVRANGRGPSALGDFKAALLYADKVVLRWDQGRPDVSYLVPFYEALRDDPSRGRVDAFVTAIVDGVERERITRDDEIEPARAAGLVEEPITVDELTAAYIFRAIRQQRGNAGLEEYFRESLPGHDPFVVPDGYVPLIGDPPPSLLTTVYERGSDAELILWRPGAPKKGIADRRPVDEVEVDVAARLLGEVPAFPLADVADILDVRERLTGPRTRFRAVVAAAADDLREVPVEDFAREVDAYRRRHLDEPLLVLREQLEELGAIPTLLRMLREKWAVPTMASIAIGAAMVDPVTVAAGAVSASGVTLAARELSSRREIRRGARVNQLWYLHAIEDHLRR